MLWNVHSGVDTSAQVTEPCCRLLEAREKNLPKCKKGTEGNKKEKSLNQKAEAIGCAVSEESPL